MQASHQSTTKIASVELWINSGECKHQKGKSREGEKTIFTDMCCRKLHVSRYRGRPAACLGRVATSQSIGIQDNAGQSLPAVAPKIDTGSGCGAHEDLF